MSKKNNVNPDHYKLAGRDRPDEIARERMKISRQHGAEVKRKPKKRS